MRPARALIDLQSLRHNYRIARELAGGRSLAVVKADAYGHGAVRCAQALEAEAADGFAVACLEEALALRGPGIRSPNLLLEGFFEADERQLFRFDRDRARLDLRELEDGGDEAPELGAAAGDRLRDCDLAVGELVERASVRRLIQ
jgi:alanine racemase